MSRPKPPRITTSRDSRHERENSLHLRTPHSRTSASFHMEEGSVHYGYGDSLHAQDHHNLQSEPLLASSTSPSFHDAYTNDTYYQDNLEKIRNAEVDRRMGGRRKPRRWTSILARLPLFFGIGLAFVLLGLIVLSIMKPDALKSMIGQNSTSDNSWVLSSEDGPQEDVVDAQLPDVVTLSSPDTQNTPTSIIDYSAYSSFPLQPAQYVHECWKLNGGLQPPKQYWSSDDANDAPHKDVTGVCKSSITYMLDGKVGLMTDLALLAQVAGLARERNRTLFIEDRYWNRGKWSDHFQDVRHTQPGPEPGCSPPPPEELVACPRTARHWVVSSLTAKFHFKHDFINEFEDPYASRVARQKPMFDRALESMDNTIKPNNHVQSLIRSARSELASLYKTPAPVTSLHRKPRYVGVHIRQGDSVPMSYEFHGKPVPIQNYVDATHQLSLHNSTTETLVYVASDSPQATLDFISKALENWEIFSLSGSTNPQLKALASPQEYRQSDWEGYSAEDRLTWTQGAVVDFALVSGLWGGENGSGPENLSGLICTVKSAICKLGAVGLGWEKSFEHGLWVDLDGKGIIDPVWTAFNAPR